MGVHLTPGQRCILNILQQKLLKTIKCYKELNSKRYELSRLLDKTIEDTVVQDEDSNNNGSANCKNNNSSDNANDNNNDRSSPTNEIIEQISSNEFQLFLLRTKIERISARQRRFTNEILSGNGNNTIPKDNYFKALGLITKEALDKINLKSGERRRRTTANPRFSHEAIQAKRALENHSQPSSQHSRTNLSRIEEKSAKGLTTRNNASEKLNNCARRGRDKSEDNNNSKGVSSSTSNDANQDPKQSQPVETLNNVRSNGRANNFNKNNKALNNIGKKLDAANHKIINSIGGTLSEEEKSHLRLQFSLLQDQIFSRIDEISKSRKVNTRLEAENEVMRKRYIDQVNLFNKLCQDGDIYSAPIQLSVPFNLVKSNGNGNIDHMVRGNGRQDPLEAHDIWMDLKCDESLEGLESSDNICEG